MKGISLLWIPSWLPKLFTEEKNEKYNMRAMNFSFIWDLLGTIAQETSSQIALRNCSESPLWLSRNETNEEP